MSCSSSSSSIKRNYFVLSQILTIGSHSRKRWRVKGSCHQTQASLYMGCALCSVLRSHNLIRSPPKAFWDASEIRKKFKLECTWFRWALYVHLYRLHGNILLLVRHTECQNKLEQIVDHLSLVSRKQLYFWELGKTKTFYFEYVYALSEHVHLCVFWMLW